jgi:hypothetical protein
MVYYTTLYYTILILYYTILHYIIQYYTNTILYYTILYYTILYYTILYYTILYYTRVSSFKYEAFRKLWCLSRNYCMHTKVHYRMLHQAIFQQKLLIVFRRLSLGQRLVATIPFQRSEYLKISSFLVLGIPKSLFGGITCVH